MAASLETGAGGSAPKHVEQFLHENFLRWDSLGEFFALAASFEHLADTAKIRRPENHRTTLDAATGKFLEDDRSPARKLRRARRARQPHFWLALYWAQGAQAAQTADPELKRVFVPVAEQLAANETKIVAELIAVQGKPIDLGGYYLPDGKPRRRRRSSPSATFKRILAGI